MMDYIITLDGPNHLYNSAVFNRMLSSDTFSNDLFELNGQITPNYSSLLILSFLLLFFKGVAALKVFHLIYVLLFAGSFYYWNNQKENKHNLSVIIFPLVYSYLFFSGFYNFILSFIIMFFILAFYEKNKWSDLKKYALLSLFLLALYFSHSIVFIFTGLALVLYEVGQIYLNKTTIIIGVKKLTWLFLAAIPCFVLILLFMNSRASEVAYLPFNELVENLYSGKSMVAKSDISNYSKWTFLGIIFIAILYAFWNKMKLKFSQHDYLLLTALATLTLYFILPDSVGYASVFSVRIEFFFWIFLLAWLARIDLKSNILKGVIIFATLIYATIQIDDYTSYWSKLNADTKNTLSAAPFITEKSIVYPIFTSNIWDHLHLSNIIGVDKNIFILENTAARQDYFPVQYKQPYEKYLDSLPGLQISNTNLSIDYVLKIGRNPAETNRDILIYNAVKEKGSLVYENELVELWKVSKVL
jgi:hypothetical protein